MDLDLDVDVDVDVDLDMDVDLDVDVDVGNVVLFTSKKHESQFFQKMFIKKFNRENN
jgi:hypothetical protein